MSHSSLMQNDALMHRGFKGLNKNSLAFQVLTLTGTDFSRHNLTSVDVRF